MASHARKAAPYFIVSKGADPPGDRPERALALAALAWRGRATSSRSPLLRAAALGILAPLAPALLACPPQGPPLGTHAETALFYVTDYQGSTVLTVRTDGTLRDRYIEAAFGSEFVQEGPGVHHRFTGGELDPAPFYALGARYYDPELGRFLAPDPLGGDPHDPQSFDRYGRRAQRIGRGDRTALPRSGRALR